MKLVMMILTVPHFIMAILCYFNKSLAKDLNICIEYINKEKSLYLKISDYYYDVLVLAEDHRNPIHYGIDPIAIIRCVYIRLTKKITQGGSTIEQQLVRRLTGRYERTLRRKIREQIIAVLLGYRVGNKRNIGKAYLCCAYYGYNKVGFFNLSEAEVMDASELIARLKYPTKKDQVKNGKNLTRRRIHIDRLVLNRADFMNGVTTQTR